MAPAGTSSLNISQKDRIRILQAIFSPVYQRSVEKWFEDFTRDTDPEREIVIWENMAKVFQAFESNGVHNISEKKEAFKLIMALSLGSNVDDIINAQIISADEIQFVIGKMQDRTM